MLGWRVTISCSVNQNNMGAGGVIIWHKVASCICEIVTNHFAWLRKKIISCLNLQVFKPSDHKPKDSRGWRDDLVVLMILPLHHSIRWDDGARYHRVITFSHDIVIKTVPWKMYGIFIFKSLFWTTHNSLVEKMLCFAKRFDLKWLRCVIKANRSWVS